MLQCPAMIALMLCDFANSWGLYVLVTEGPIFFSEALCFDIKKVRAGAVLTLSITSIVLQVGFLSSLPYLGRFVGAQIFGLISSFVRRRNALSPLALQKLNAFISFVGPAAGMVWMSHETSSPYLCTAIMSVAYAFNGAAYSGHSNNSLTISPNR